MAGHKPHHPKALFLEAVSSTFLRETGRLVIGAYEAARRHCEALAPPEAHDLMPHARKAFFDGAWREFAKGAGLIATPELNDGKNCYHTLIASERVRLTASAVETANTLVRHANFRETYARDNQLCLFGDTPPRPEAPLYAMLIHGPTGAVKTPLFMEIVFPLPDCSGYHEERISILKLFPELVKPLEVREELVLDAAQPILITPRNEA